MSSDDETTLAATLAGLPPVRRRRKLWDIQGGLQCSIVGTCFSQEDLLALARKTGHRVPKDAAAYDLHSFFVREASKVGLVSRAMQKLLEQRYAAIVRKVGTCRTDAELAELWDAESAAGRIPGAYWAFLSYNHVPQPLGTRIFGEVHMLSHVLSRVTRDSLNQVSTQQARIDDMAAQISRQSERNRQILAERDAAQAKLALLLSSQSMPEPGAASMQPCSSSRPINVGEAIRSTRRERALIAARERARSGERQVGTLREEVARLKALLRSVKPAAATACSGANACHDAVRADIARKVLYIGGRTGAVDLLRQAAARVRTELLHHDGGEQEALWRIDAMVEGCDAVFCPMDCVSHSACLRAKALCRKLRKPFVPLRSSGTSSFERALASLTAGG